MARKYRKLPVVIEAVQFRLGGSWEEYQAFCPTLVRLEQGTGLIPTLEGEMTVSPGDWIIKGVSGEFYPCRRDIFSRTYEVAER